MTEDRKTISMAKANFLGLIFGILLVGILALPYYLMYGPASTGQARQFAAFSIFNPSVVIGIMVHEAIHGMTWAMAAKVPMSQIKFGFQFRTITPYAHCKVPISMRAYRTGTLMPFLILGLAPWMYALASQDAVVLGFGLFFSFSAIGDLIILWITRDIDADRKVQDHPTEGGVIIVD